ncbi:MAG: hypothetical protein WCB96_00935 [Candidatus Aminicenantales bacterium]
MIIRFENWRFFSTLSSNQPRPASLTAILLFFLSFSLVMSGQETARESVQPKISFDARFEPSVTSKLSAAGDILVQPLMNNQEAGWFRLDPGVQGMRITAAQAEILGLTKSGTMRIITSSNKLEERPVWSGASFQIGPLLAEGLDFAEMDQPAAAAEEDNIIGVIGTAVLQSAVAELEVNSGKVRLFDPSSYESESGPAAWQEFSVQRGLPAVSCRFEGDREGKFGLDLRSPLGIMFFSSAVSSMALLQDRPTAPVTVSGATFSQIPAQTGSLQWFEAAGMRVESPQAVFLVESIGLAAEKDLAGLLGREFLGGFVLVLDFAKSRLALLRK